MTREDIIEAARDLGSADRLRGPGAPVSREPDESGTSPLERQASIQTRQFVSAFAFAGGDDHGLYAAAVDAYVAGYDHSSALRVALDYAESLG